MSKRVREIGSFWVAKAPVFGCPRVRVLFLTVNRIPPEESVEVKHGQDHVSHYPLSIVFDIQQKGSSSGGKKKLSGFMLFSKEHRPKIKEDNPDITFGQIGKKLGEMWRALDEKEKQAYKDRKE